uniref:hypothetical protein n=1 Tax=Castellaniella defragrans TaxID=75697 RepID=UPI00333E3F2E
MNYGNTPALFSDALERAYTQAVMDASGTVSIKDMFRAIGRGIKYVGTRMVHAFGDMTYAQAQARARDARYSRTQW